MAAPTITVEMSLNGANWKSSPGGGAYFTGGTITEAGGYRIHTFTSGGTLTMVTPGDVDYLVVGGGGGGGLGAQAGGGGGAGGVKSGTGLTVSATQTITVGAGGAKAANNAAQGSTGSDSSIGSLVTAHGGGGGGSDSGSTAQAGANGASGGGGAATTTAPDVGGPGGTGTGGEGSNGGKGTDGTATTGNRCGGGGGGASAVGADASFGVPGVGGDGTASSISGTSTTYGGGGGGGRRGAAGAAGGAGGGGAGNTAAGSDAVSGTANTGGGGGGGGFGTNGGDGGSGIVIVRYLNAGAPAVDWTDVTDHVLFSDGVQITRGRSGPRDEVRAGTCTFTLQDTTRLFDPENASGTHYGFLNPGVPVRVTATHNSIDYERFFGFVEDFPQSAPDPADRRVLIPIQAIDLFGMLAMSRQPSVLEFEILADSPVAYWKLNETEGVTMFDASGNEYHGEYTFGTTALAGPFGDSAPASAINFDGTHIGVVQDISSAITDRPCVLEAFIAPSSEGASPSIVYQSGSGNPDAGSILSLQYALAPGYWVLTGSVIDGDADNVTISNAHDFDAQAHVAYRRPASGAAVTYVDGVDDTDSTTTTSIGAAQTPGSAVGAGKTVGGTVDSGFEGWIGSVAVFDTDIGAARIAVHAAAALAPLDGQTTDERIGFLLDAIGFPSADRALTAGYTTLGPAIHEGEYTLDLIRRVEKTEQGRFFMARNGDATFHARYHCQLVETSSSATFSDDGSDVAYANVETNRARQYIYNKVTVTADGLSPVTVYDTTSIDTHGERELSLDAPLLPSAAQQRSLAEYVLALYKDPQPRVTGLSIPVHKNWTTWVPIVLPLEQGDRVTFERQPVGTGTAMSWSQTLEGYSERFDTTSWTWTPSLSPAEPVTFMVWGGSDVAANHWGTGLLGY